MSQLLLGPGGGCGAGSLQKTDMSAGVTQRRQGCPARLPVGHWAACSPAGLHWHLTPAKAFSQALLGTGKVSEQHDHQAKPVHSWKEPSKLLLGAYLGLPLNSPMFLSLAVTAMEQCCHTERDTRHSQRLSSAKGQDRPPRSQNFLLTHPQTHYSSEQLGAELVAWLSVL